MKVTIVFLAVLLVATAALTTKESLQLPEYFNKAKEVFDSIISDHDFAKAINYAIGYLRLRSGMTKDDCVTMCKRRPGNALGIKGAPENGCYPVCKM